MVAAPDNSVVIVTGAGGTGCGRAIAARFAVGGAKVVVSDINETGGYETVRFIETAVAARRSFVRTCGRSRRCAIWFPSRKQRLAESRY